MTSIDNLTKKGIWKKINFTLDSYGEEVNRFLRKKGEEYNQAWRRAMEKELKDPTIYCEY